MSKPDDLGLLTNFGILDDFTYTCIPEQIFNCVYEEASQSEL